MLLCGVVQKAGASANVTSQPAPFTIEPTHTKRDSTMPHHHTAPTPAARESAAAHLRESAAALRELAHLAEDINRIDELPNGRAQAMLDACTPAGRAAVSRGEIRTNDELRAWALGKAAEYESVAEWLALPFGRCDDCGQPLQHFVSENVGGVVCPDCDREFVEEVAEHAPLAGLEHRHPSSSPICKCSHTTADHRGNDYSSCQVKGCDCAGFTYPKARSEEMPCAVCRHDIIGHTWRVRGVAAPVGCECCARGEWHAVDPETPLFAGAIAEALRSRPVHCTACGGRLMLDHSVCFSDDCQRARAERHAKQHGGF